MSGIFMAAEIISSATNSVQMICCKCTTCVCVGVSQIIIAAFAVVSGIVALFKYRNEKKRSSPRLNLVFEDREPYYSITEDDVDTGARNRQQTFKVRLENNGACPAKDCKVKVSRLTIISDGNEYDQAIDEGKNTHLEADEIKQRPISINNGDYLTLSVFKVCVNREDGKGAGASGGVSDGDKASILVIGEEGVIHAFRTHQTHVKIELKLIAEMFASKSYIFEFEWRGDSVSAIGSVASYVATIKEM